MTEIAFFSFQPSGPRYNCGIASSVKTLNERQRLSPLDQKFVFFRTAGTEIQQADSSIVEKRYSLKQDIEIGGKTAPAMAEEVPERGVGDV